MAFQSNASNLVAGDTNDQNDIFVADRNTDTVERVSVASDGTQANDRSGSVMVTGWTFPPTGDSSSLNQLHPTWSPGDTNDASDVFLFMIASHSTTQRVSVASGGVQADFDSSEPSISDDGQFIAFVSTATNLVAGEFILGQDVYLYDQVTDQTELISKAVSGGFANDAVARTIWHRH